MTKTVSTKRALLTSVLSLLLCVSMLIGSTFAWFTDTATVNVSTITAGDLDIQLLNAEGTSLEGKTLTLAGDNVSQVIEPNGTYEFEPVTIKNAGDVNLKYKLALTGIEGDAGLLKVLTWEFIVDSQSDTDFDTYEGTLAPNESHVLKIRFTMDKDAGNEYKKMTLTGIALNVMATQATGEFDSFQDDYDKLAEYPTTDAPDNTEPEEGPVEENVGTLTELKAAFAAAAEQSTGDITINLTKSFDVAGAWEAISPEGYNGVNNVIINGNGFTIKNLNEPLMVGSFAGSGSITINDLTIESANITHANYNGMGLGAFVTYSDNSGSVALNNCRLLNSEITCTDGYAGGLVGYTSSAMTITNCSVINSTINGQKSAGAIVGHGGANVTVNGCEVSGCTISETLEGRTSAGAGAIAGRMSGGTLTLKGTITVKGNTINQGAAVTGTPDSPYCALGTPVIDEATFVTE